MKTKTYETVDCECGKECPVEFAIIDDNGCWTCPTCVIDFITEQANGVSDNDKPCALGVVVGRSEQFKDFLQEVADWDKDYSSTLIKLKAKELLKGF